MALACPSQLAVCSQWRPNWNGSVSTCDLLQYPVRRSIVSVSTSGSMLMPMVAKWRIEMPITASRRGFAAVGGAVGALAGVAFAWICSAAGAMTGEGGQQRAILSVRTGMQLFTQGDVKGSLDKFDEALELDPRQLPYLWQRGLSLYYLDRFEEGAKQFRDDVAVNPNDTEESIWCFLCEAQIYGVEEARRNFLVVGPDRRSIMKKIYDVFRYGGSADEILGAVSSGNEANFFYASLYAGLYCESHGQDGAKEAILAAVHSPYGTRSTDYMASLARVHAECRGWKPQSIAG